MVQLLYLSLGLLVGGAGRQGEHVSVPVLDWERKASGWEMEADMAHGVLSFQARKQPSLPPVCIALSNFLLPFFSGRRSGSVKFYRTLLSKLKDPS